MPIASLLREVKYSARKLFALYINPSVDKGVTVSMIRNETL
jgi:hypothetical protein